MRTVLKRRTELKRTGIQNMEIRKTARFMEGILDPENMRGNSPDTSRQTVPLNHKAQAHKHEGGEI